MVRIFEMVSDDVPYVQRIEECSFGVAQDISMWLRELSLPFSRNYVAKNDEGQILGFISFWVLKVETQLIQIAVDEGSKRRGIGSVLLQKMLDVSAELGIKEVSLEVSEKNRAAYKLYRKFGFQVVGKRKAYYSRIDGDALIMRKVIC
ncbi:MAG: ribosomal protein S18-alanine N-acetyltransferase [Syntrophales bacterium]|nr:ribosomal protein S18-alanine N-acetyltransferase [Syntrophales bacterium]